MSKSQDNREQINALFTQAQQAIRALAQVTPTGRYHAMSELRHMAKSYEVLTHARRSAAAIAGMYKELPGLHSMVLGCEVVPAGHPDSVDPMFDRYSVEIFDIEFDGALPRDISVDDLGTQLGIFFNSEEDYNGPPELQRLLAPLEPLYSSPLGKEGQDILYRAMTGYPHTHEKHRAQQNITRDMIEACEGDVDALTQALFPETWDREALVLGLRERQGAEESRPRQRLKG